MKMDEFRKVDSRAKGDNDASAPEVSEKRDKLPYRVNLDTDIVDTEGSMLFQIRDIDNEYKAYVRELTVDSVGAFGDLIKSVPADLKVVDKLKLLGQKVTSLWKELKSRGLVIPDFNVVISPGSHDTNEPALHILADKVYEFKTETEEDIENKNHELNIILGTLIDYSDNLKVGDYFWGDLKPEQFVYGTTQSDPEPKWYMVDLDPRFVLITSAEHLSGVKNSLQMGCIEIRSELLDYDVL